MDGAPDGSADREPMKPSIDSRKPAPLPQQVIDEDAELYEPPVCIPYHCVVNYSKTCLKRPLKNTCR